MGSGSITPYGNTVLLAALTGLRQGELFGLRDRNVDLEAKTLIVENGVYKGELVPVKTRASRRRVDLSGTAVRVLRRQLLARKPHDAALMVAAGAHPKYLQIQMGHSSIRVTLDLYGHLFPDANRGVLDALEALTAPSTPHRANAAKIAAKEKV